ncbi:MAG: MerR family transcriptional regulator [Anaerolineae bacterium]|nr:MerR family transcriptional regulator [Anaerolineae bacterium]
MMNPERTYTIQEVSQATSLPGSTLRYYEEMELLEPVERGTNGHRRYTETDLRRIQMIKRLRLTGMSIDRMRAFIALYRGGARTAGKRREILQAHRLTVQAHLDELLEMIGFIDYKIALYEDEEKQGEREQNYEVSVTG